MSYRWSPEFQDTLSRISCFVFDGGEISASGHKREQSKLIGGVFVTAALFSEGGRTREVGDGKRTIATVTYLAYLSLRDNISGREFALLEDGQVFKFVDPLDHEQPRIRDFASIDEVVEELEALNL